MVFNSYLFILAFLPILLIAYFGANKIGPRWVSRADWSIRSIRFSIITRRTPRPITTG